VLGVSELMVKAKPLNKTEDPILKIKEVMGSLDRDTVAKAYNSYTRPGLRLSSPLTAILLNLWILNLFICNFYFILTKSDDFQRCCDNL
jgi:beta-lactamase regulating signal transducer with metallopeptidase domain